MAVNMSNGVYQLVSKQKLLQFDGEKTIGYYDLKTDPNMKNDLSANNDKHRKAMETTLKAMLQQHNNRLIYNTLRR